MKLYLTGLSYKTAPVEVRERLALGEAALEGALGALRGIEGVEEALILSTCNRVEVAVHADGAGRADEIVRVFAGECKVAPESIAEYLYAYEDKEAIRHLFRVASSLDSMVLGEPQILGQLKAAYAAARRQSALNGFLDTVVTRAFSVAKRVRSETAIGRNAVSVSFAAVELARQIFGDLSSRSVLLIGAGKMSELAARHLKRAGARRIYVTNRTRARAEEMAAQVGGEVIGYEEFRERLAQMDIVLTSSGAPDYLLGKDEMKQVLRRRQNRPVFLIDIAVPRNVDPKVDELEGVYLYDIDDLGREVASNRAAREAEAVEAEQIIEEEIGRLDERMRAREVAPVIVGLQQQLEEISRVELERVRARLGALSAQQEEALQAYTRGLLNKIAHGPMTEIRRAAALPEGERILSVIRRMFRLEER